MSTVKFSTFLLLLFANMVNEVLLQEYMKANLKVTNHAAADVTNVVVTVSSPKAWIPPNAIYVNFQNVSIVSGKSVIKYEELNPSGGSSNFTMSLMFSDNTSDTFGTNFLDDLGHEGDIYFLNGTRAIAYVTEKVEGITTLEITVRDVE